MEESRTLPQADPDAGVIWVSGVITTFFSKVVMPTLWVGALIGVPLWVYVTRGGISVRPDVRFLVVFAFGATVILGWMTVHLQLVGYRGRELVVANYWREARIPFEQVEAIENVWWYRGRLVRVRFNQPTPFGTLVYYMPKWGTFRVFWSNPAEELQRAVGAGAGRVW